MGAPPAITSVFDSLAKQILRGRGIYLIADNHRGGHTTDKR
jgi:hypothetical protein